MTDLEMTKLCAEAMGWKPAGTRHDFDTVKAIPVEQFPGAPHYQYAPLHDDAQCFALVKKFHPIIVPGIRTPKGREPWHVEIKSPDWDAYNTDLNCAIVECVAKMQQGKS